MPAVLLIPDHSTCSILAMARSRERDIGPRKPDLLSGGSRVGSQADRPKYDPELPFTEPARHA